MTKESKALTERFPIRKTAKQKAAFRLRLCSILTEAGFSPVEEGTRSSRNVVVGDPEKAEVVLTAHYDTCAVLPVPNLITPRNPVVFLSWQLLLAALILGLAAGAEVLVLALFDPPLWVALAVLYAVLFFLLWWMMAGKANQHNLNDNTSGVITLLEAALSLPEESRGRVAFVFFDNEEKGLLGSAAFYKKHRETMKHKLLLNFDCVGDGDHILFFPSAALRRDKSAVRRLEQAFPSAGDKQIQVCTRGFSVYPSDQKHFPVSAGVAALHKAPLVGYWLGRIHTRRDTVLEEENIALLVRGIRTLITCE